MATDADHLHRTVKIEIDEGRASSVEEAMELVASYVLQVQIGEGVERSPAAEATLLTILNTGHRAFLGGVKVWAEDDPVLNSTWAEGRTLSEAVTAFGGELVSKLEGEHPTLVIGEPASPLMGSIILYATYAGWSGGVVEHPTDCLSSDHEFALAGVLAGALGVSEAFQHIRGNQEAGRRSVGLSLWSPELDWRAPEAEGPLCKFLPSELWLLGLGHLGQAYCWGLGFLPYVNPTDVMLYLLDYDIVVKANESTGLLVEQGVLGKTKARVVAERMEKLGFQTRISERAFDKHTQRTAEEPALALAGFDTPVPRRELEDANFVRIVDAGLGAGVNHYYEMVLHSFPSGLHARDAFEAASMASRRPEQPAYQEMVKERVSAGETEGEAKCGILEIAGRTVGASFVGAVAAALVIAETLRILAHGPRYEVIDLSLRSPQHREVIENGAPGEFVNPGFVEAA
jgi:hypothetical protein